MSADNIVQFNGATTLPVEPDRVLSAALGKMQTVIVIGITSEGEEYFAASTPDRCEVNYLADRLKHFMMKSADQENEA